MLFVVRNLSLCIGKTTFNTKDVNDLATKTYTNQSMAKSNMTSWVGMLRVLRTIMIMIKADDGTDETAKEEVKARIVTVRIWPTLKSMPFIWAMKIDETATMTAVPSMLLLQPIGSTNFVMRGSILISLSITWNVTGKAAALKRFNDAKKRQG